MADTHIKIKPVVPRVQYVGNGVTTDFAYSFAIFDETDMQVYIGDTLIDPDATVIIGEGDDAVEYPVYTITGVGEEDGGEVIFTVAPENDAIITLVRNVPVERMTDFQEGGTFRPKNLNDELDRQTAFCQQIEEALNRCVKVDVTSQIQPSEILPQIERLYESVDNIDTVSEHVDEIDTVSNNMTDVNNCSMNMAAIQDAPTQASNAAGSANDAALSAQQAAISAAGTKFKLFHHDWFDYELNDMAWLRADTFSWQDGTVYSNAYDHLVNDIGYVWYMIPDDGFDIKFYRAPAEDTEMYAWTNSFSTLYTEKEFPENGDNFYYHNQISGTVLSVGVEAGSGVVTPTTETISGYTITYYPATDGHKIVLADQETAVLNIYNATGVAWYYILDTTNQRFKLPRENPLKEEIVNLIQAPVKGTGKSIGMTNGVEYGGVAGVNQGMYGNLVGKTNLYNANVSNGAQANDNRLMGTLGVTTDASMSGLVTVLSSSTSSSFYKGKKYLYFYVGQYTQTATEQTAGLNSELFNGKVDLDASNLNATGKSTIAGLPMPSNNYDNLTAGASWTGYTAPANGWFCAYNGTSHMGWVVLYNITTQLRATGAPRGGLSDGCAIVPAKKGDEVVLGYADDQGVNFGGPFIFVYAEGDK